MTGEDILAGIFEADRERLRGVAYRILGSLAEADDAIQEAWLRLSSSKSSEIENIGGWLTTVVARISLDMLRSRKARREDLLVTEDVESILNREAQSDPEQEALLAEAVGIGLMVILDRLAPTERLAFVLHDLFGFSFDDIASIMDRSSVAVRQLASRARRRVRDVSLNETANALEQRRAVGAFFSASREGNYEALLELLDPEVVLRIDRRLLPQDAPDVLRGAATVARRAQLGARQGLAAELMLIDGRLGVVVAPLGRLRLVMTFVLGNGKIQQIELIAKPARLRALQLTLLDD